ncbi:MAG: 3-phosphoshikimate 1-carboxyvinyltransferase [Acidimicrobiales bacterium]|nr:3-phosphoshikimate 1-carboxyvinyltransferase [Acidimicrobiales bacterium]
MSVIKIAPAKSLKGQVVVPGDKSISHRALLIGSMAKGVSRFSGLNHGEDVAATAQFVSDLGCETDLLGSWGSKEFHVKGGMDSYRSIGRPVWAGNSGTLVRLGAGLVAGCNFTTVFEGDESLSNRPMERIMEPLRAMGAEITGVGDRCTLPLSIHGPTSESKELVGITWVTPVASAQVKSSILLAGLRANGVTTVKEPIATRRHTEEILALAGIPVEEYFEDGYNTVSIQRASYLDPIDLHVPGDPSQAAFWVVGATLLEGSELVIPNIYCGVARDGFLKVLTLMGANIEKEEVKSDVGPTTLNLVVRSVSELSSIEIQKDDIAGLIDEIPILAVAAGVANGVSRFCGLSELRVKETDRLAGIVSLLESFGVEAAVEGDDLVIEGLGTKFQKPGRVETNGDHRMAMAGAIGALSVEGVGSEVETTINGWESVATSYPGFSEDIEVLTTSNSITS